MYFDKIKLGINIRNLRKAYGETQKELGNIIGVTDTTISMYESGSNVPDMDTLQTIAEHYRITVDELIDSDFSKMNLKDLNVTWYNVVKAVLAMYPIVYTKEALEDELFVNAYKETIIYFKRRKEKDESISNRSITRLIKKYTLSYESTHCLEAAANIVALLMTRYFGESYTHAEKMSDALYYGLGTKKDFAKKYMLKDRKEFEIEVNENQKQKKKKYYKEIIKWIKILKESSMYVELVDYYMALLFVKNIVVNDNSETVNSKIGFDMLLLLVDLDNRHAISFLKVLSETSDEK